MNDPSAPVERPGTGLPPADAHPLETSLREKAEVIRAEQIKLLFASAPLALAGHWINGLFLTFILWDAVSRAALLGWLTYTVVVASVRFLFVRMFWRRSPGPLEIPRWGRLFNVGSALSGLGWGLAAFLIFPEQSIAHQVFLTLVVAGMGAGAVTLVAAVKEAFFSFTIPTFLPLILRLLTHTEPIENAMGVMVALFAGYMISTGLKMHATITTSLSLRFENKDLLDDLAAQIVERKRSEEALRLSNERFELAAEGSREGLWDIAGSADEPGGLLNPCRPIYYSPRFKALLGFTDQEFPNVLGSWASRLHPDDQPRVFAALQAHLERKAPYEIEYRLLTKGGDYRWYIARGQALWDETGRPFRMAGSLSDITERKRLEGLLQQHAEDLEQRVQKRTEQLVTANDALRSEVDDRQRVEQSLRESERRIRMILETAREAVISIDANGKVLDWNPHAEKTFGWSRAEAVGRNLASLIIPTRYREAHAQGLRRFLEYGEGPVLGNVVELTALHRNKHEFPVELTVTQVYMAGAWTFTAFARDITERKRVEEEMRRTQNFLNSIVGHTPNMMFVKDARTLRFVLFNKASEDLLGIPREEMLGKTVYDLFPEDQADFLTAQDQQVLADKQLLDIPEEPIQTRVKGIRILHTKKIPVLDEQGEPLYLLGFSEDITDRRLLEERLRQAQKMEALGRLAGGVAHDFNNLLTVITGSCQLLLRRLGKDDPVREKVERTMKAGERGASLTRQLLAFSRQQVLTPKILDLNTIIIHLKEILWRLIGEDVSLVTSLAPALGRVKADRGQIEQVIMNLIVNARDAMPAGGRITITTKNIDLAEGYAHGADVVPSGSYVSLEVTDTGCGIDAEARAHIFEPFFTTKEPGKGTGLGLATVYGIVKESGGIIALSSEIGKGSTFTIYLPRIEGTVETPEPARVPPETLRGSATILLVEDDGTVRTMVREMLQEGGYTLLEARNGTEALHVCQGHSGPIHLLLTDMVMPGMSGLDLAQRLAELRPGTKVLYMSGYTDKAVAHQELTLSGVAFLQKPINRTIWHAKCATSWARPAEKRPRGLVGDR